MINQEVKELDQLIGEVLSFNKVDMGRLEFHAEETDIKAFCDSIVERFRAISDTQSLVYTVEDGLTPTYVDTHLLDHVLSNLLSNAFKYSPSGSPVYLQVSQDDEGVIFKVVDEGVGIPLKNRNTCFRRSTGRVTPGDFRAPAWDWLS